MIALTMSGYGQNVKKFMKAGDAFMKNGKYEDAIVQYTNAIDLKPSDLKGYLSRAGALDMLERYEDAYSDLERARVFYPKDIDVLYMIGRVCNKMERYEEALKSLNYASTLAKREERLYPEKICSLLGLERYDLAISTSDTALMFRENDINLYQRGVAFERLNNDIRARKDYEKSISKNKRYEPARLALANLLIREGDLEGATRHINVLISEDDRNARAYSVRSRIFIEQLDYPSAINDISRNILMEPGNPEHYAIRGTYYQGFNQHSNAISDFTRAITLDSLDPDLYFARAHSYEELMELEKAVKDYTRITELSEFDMKARKMLKETDERLYELHREANPPLITLTSPTVRDTRVEIRGDADDVVVSGIIDEASDLKSLTINGYESLFEKGSNGLYQFLSTVDVEDAEILSVVAEDIYNNTTTVNYDIYKTEINPPVITIIAPYADDNGDITLQSNSSSIYLEGRIMDESRIKSIMIEGVTASYPVDEFNPTFTASIDILNKKKITVVAEDNFGNRRITDFNLNREGAMLNAENPMGKTWVIFVENSNYQTFASLDGPAKDVNLMRRALEDYQIHNVIHKRDLTRSEMERFFSFELRDLISSNQVKSLLIWYAGHGKFSNDVGYWIPIDAKRDDEFTYFNINTLKAAMMPYVNLLTHTLVVTDACETGPGFYTSMRSNPVSRSCDDWEATNMKSSQVFASADRELASDDSQFTRTFANSLMGNTNACLPIEDIVSKVTLAVTNNNQQKPKFGQISGLAHEDGTFFFIAK